MGQMRPADEGRAQGLRYVRDRLAERRPQDEIVQALVGGGWSEADARALVDEAVAQAARASLAAPPPPASSYGSTSGAADTTPNPLATVALVLAFVPVLAPIGLLLGVSALSRRGGRRAATASVIVGAVVTLLSVLILPAVLFPLFAIHREYGGETSCQSNLKQLALATLMYSQDYDGRLPDARKWPQATYPYYKNPVLLTCPADRHPKPVPGISWPPGKGLSYAMSADLSGRKLAAIGSPAKVPMLFDSDVVPANQPEGAAFRHGAGPAANFAFVDGHVTSLTRPQLLSLRRH